LSLGGVIDHQGCWLQSAISVAANMQSCV